MRPTLAVRPATPSDYDSLARLIPELRTDDPIPTADRYEQVIMPDTLFFEADGEVVAYVFVQVLTGVAYVRNVVVDPSHRGKGVGLAVMEIARSRLRAGGCSSWCLNVKPDNTPAVRLYERVGMRAAYIMTALRFPWDILGRLPRRARSVVARRVTAADAVSIEIAFSLPKGQVESDLAKPTRLLWMLVDAPGPGGPPLGYASFDREFPGAYPFRVAEPELAVPLLEALRPHARPEIPYMQCVIEADDALTKAFLDAGALVRLSGVHMKGEL